MSDSKSIAETLARHRAELEVYHVKEMWLFGSASRGEAKARDIDLLVEFNKTPSLIEFVQLKEQLEMILSRPVDLVSKKGCKARFLREIAGDLRHVA